MSSMEIDRKSRKFRLVESFNCATIKDLPRMYTELLGEAKHTNLYAMLSIFKKYLGISCAMKRNP